MNRLLAEPRRHRSELTVSCPIPFCPERICIFRYLSGIQTRSGLMLATAALCLCGCSEKPAHLRLIEVTVATPIRQDVPVYSQWIGTTVGFIDAEIHSKVTGYLLTQDYQEGSLVKIGDLVFQVDPRPFRAVADEAYAQLNVANAD